MIGVSVVSPSFTLFCCKTLIEPNSSARVRIVCGLLEKSLDQIPISLIESLKDDMLKEIKHVEWFPKWGEVRMENMVKDPVCKMDVDENSTSIKSEYKGKTYYFCMPGCKARFDENPENFL